MNKDVFFHVWFVIASLHTVWIAIKLFPHFKRGYEHYFWLGIWLYSSSCLDDEGKKIRFLYIIFFFIYIVGGIVIFRKS